MHLRTLLGAACLVATPLAAQRASTARAPVVFDDEGLTFNAPDGFTTLTLRFRLQQWMTATTFGDGDPAIDEVNLTIRRARLSLESVLWDPRLHVKAGFAFSRRDAGVEGADNPNLLREAAVSFEATPRLTLTAGQSKMPGNRQGSVSSAELQFPDRSIVYGAFGMDLDMGVFAAYETGAAAFPVVLRAAVTGGEGRNAPPGTSGLAYSARVDVMPLGRFAADGEESEGALDAQPAPRLAVGAAISRNDRAARERGQTGAVLPHPLGFTTGYLDALFKHGRFAASAEYARRIASDPFATDGVVTLPVMTGDGVMAQASFMVRPALEPAIRFALVTPHRDVADWPGIERHRQLSGAITRYLKGHHLKLQAEVMRDDFRDAATRTRRGSWTLRTSLEAGI